MLMVVDNHKNLSFKRMDLHPKDLAYKKLLQQGLKDTYGINCKIKDLDPIAGPMELKGIINNLKSSQYEVGDNFRANFHLHTQASDGRLTPKEFLRQSCEWANKIFKSGKPKEDGLPAFSAAITDHNKIDSVKETIALISQEPDKYKNFKFVTGCEFMFDGYKDPYPAFEAVGLGFNPFDKNIEPLAKGLGHFVPISETNTVKEAGGVLSFAHPIVTPHNINPDFFKFLKENGVNGAEGNYQYNHWKKEYIDSKKPELDKLINQFKMFITGGTDSHSNSIF